MKRKKQNLFSLSSDPNNEEDNNFLIRIWLQQVFNFPYLTRIEREERSAIHRYIKDMYSRERMELFLRFETSSCRIGSPIVREWWRGGYWFSICILPIATHASFQVTNQRTKQATSPLQEGKTKKKKDRKWRTGMTLDR